MEKIKIDAVGIDCPKPVIMTKKEFDAIDQGIVEVTADNDICVENLRKFASTNSFDFESEQTAEDRWIVTITKSEGQGEVVVDDSLTPAAAERDDSFVIAVGSKHFGQGSEDLGEVLMKSFFYTVTETEPLPKTIVFYNDGIFLTTKGSPVLDDIIKLEEMGVEIVSCGTCLDFHEKKDDLAVGTFSNMYDIYEAIKNAGRNLVLG